jgi:septal ring factor EnvC (AmiA/AmiB activator)
MDHNALFDAAGTGLGTALISAFVSLATLVVGSFATAAKRRADERMAAATRESQIQELALKQWEAASKSLRDDVDRYRLEVDRLRADNDRLQRAHDEMAGQLMRLQGELEQERQARMRAETQVAELTRRLGGAA